LRFYFLVWLRLLPHQVYIEPESDLFGKEGKIAINGQKNSRKAGF